MTVNSAQHSAPVADEALSIWKEFDPVEGYAAGFKDCEGKLFIPTPSAKANLLRRITDISPRLTEIADDDLRAAATKLLGAISVGVYNDSPDEQIFNCALALWYATLNQDQHKAFIEGLLEQGVVLVQLEYARWRGQKFSGETRKSVQDACAFLDTVLNTLKASNPGVTDSIDTLSKTLAEYRSLFPFSLAHPDNFEELFNFLVKNSLPASKNECYPQILAQMFDFGAIAEEIRKQSEQMLAQELELARDVVAKLADRPYIRTRMSLGATYNLVTEHYAIGRGVVNQAKRMMAVINTFVDTFVQDFGPRPNILPESTPPFLEPLVTSGATIALNYARGDLLVKIFVTEEKNKSWLTLLNVLVHEATHAYHPSILAANKEVPDLAKLKTWLAIPFSEAAAFHRELEIFEAVKEEAEGGEYLNITQEKLLRLFDATNPPLQVDVLAFELETRVWRIIRTLRTLCDIEVNSGERTYVDFIKWANAHTNLSKEFIHNECFTFLSTPGYTPSYSFCGSQYEALQKQAGERGVSNLSFNTKSNRMGLWPWTVCLKRMNQIGATDEKN